MNGIRCHKLFICILLTATTLIPQRGSAVAYCALRDPIEAIQFLYPHADSHRSIVRAIDNEARQEILALLSFSLHFNELGKHTLYTILKAGNPIGFVHVRSEPASWGLMEVAWALSPDLQVKNFMFQRCRSAICSPETISAMLSLLANKPLHKLKTYLDDSGEVLTPAIAQQVSLEDKAFVAALVRSALKTIAVTGITWKDEIQSIQHRSIVSNVFPLPPSSFIENNISVSAVNALKDIHQGGGSMVNIESVKAFTITANDKNLGFLASGEWNDHHRARLTHWVFDPNGHVLKTITVPKFTQPKNSHPLKEVEGVNVSHTDNCATALALMGHDLYFLASYGAR